MQKWFKRHKLSTRLGVLVGFIGFVASVFDLQERFFPNGITMPTIPHFSPNWIFWLFAIALLALVYRQEQKRDSQIKKDGNFGIRLEETGKLFEAKQIKIILTNQNSVAAQNVTIEILSITPEPMNFENKKFPILLPTENSNRIINPKSEIQFNFCVVETIRDGLYGLRRITFLDEQDNQQSFDETMYEMLKKVSSRECLQETKKIHPNENWPIPDSAYILEIQISALDNQPLKKQIRLKIFPTEGDIGGLSLLEGYYISIV